MKHDKSPGLQVLVKKEWLVWWKDRLGNPSTTPRQVLWSYVEDLGITVVGLDACWDEDNVDVSWQD